MARPAQSSDVPHPGRQRPNLSGDLGTVLTPAPCFRRQLHGYDPLEVDNYVAWAETELETTTRTVDELAERLARRTAELQQTERRMATSPAGWELGRVSERVGDILRLAADEAADLVEAADAEAERLRTEGRQAAAALLHEAHEVRARAAADSDRLHELADAARQRAEEELRRARLQAAVLVRAVTVLHAAATAEAADAHRAAEEELAAARDEHTLAQQHRTQAEQVLARLSGELETALGELTPASPVLSVVPPDRPRTDAVEHRSAS